MKKIYKIKYIYILLIILLFLPVFGDAFFVLAEENETVETGDTSSTVQSEIKEDSIADSGQKNDTSETFKESNESYVDSETNMFKSPSMELFHDFSPPAQPGGGTPIFGEGSTDAQIREWIRKYGLSQILALTKITKDGILGESIGDTTSITISDNNNIHLYVPMAEHAPAKSAESWYGFLRIKNLIVTSQDDAIKIDTVKEGSNYKLVITRLKEDTKTSYDISVTYSGEYPYYTSMFGYIGSRPVWSNWGDAGTLQLDSNTVTISQEAKPVPETLRATSISQTADLTKSKGYLKQEKLVKNVKFGMTALEENEYQVEVLEEPDYLTVGEKKAKVKITYNNEELIIDVPVTIEWGNSIHLKAKNGDSILALSIERNNANPTMFAKRGASDGTGSISNESGEYLGVDIYKPSWGGYSKVSSTAYDGSDKKEDAYKKIRNYKIESNEIIKIYHKDIRNNPELVNIYTNSIKDTPNKKSHMINDELYLSTTGKEFKMLNFNQFKAKEGIIKLGADQAYLDSHINDFIDMRGLEQDNISLEFKRYPDTATAGKKKGVIAAKQLINGSSISQDYDVDFTVEDTNLVVKGKDADILLGTSKDQIKIEDFIESVSLDETQLLSEDYDLELINTPITDIVGNTEVKVKITLTDDPDKTVEVTQNGTVKWGNTLVIKNQSDYAVNISVSLLQTKDGKPYIVANRGDGFPSGQLTVRPNYNLFRENEQNLIMGGNEGTIVRPPSAIMEDWNNRINSMTTEIKYGDVARVHVRKWNSSSIEQSYYTGERTYASRNEKLEKETEGYRFAYYELTPNGYRLLRLNQFEIVNDNKVPIDTTKEEMDKNILEYITIPNHINNPQDYRMEFESVATDTTGKKTSTIKIYEKLQSGGEFMTTYTVNYDVIDDRIEGESTNLDMLVGSELSDDELYKLVKNVKIGGQNVDVSRYKVLLENNIDTNFLGEKTVDLTLENLETGKKSEIITSKINVVLGNTLEFLGFARQSVMGLTLSKNQDGTAKEIYSNWLRRDWRISTVHDKAGLYIETKLLKQNADISTIQDLSIDYSSQIEAKDNIAEAYKKFERQDYNYGDILYAYHREGTYGGGQLFNRYQDGVKSGRWTGDAGYFELTESGFEPLYIDKLSTKRVKANKGSSISDLEKRISEFIDKNGRENIEVISFSQNGYPNLEQEGIQKVRINVRETLKSGKKIEQEYGAELQVNPIVNESFTNDEDKTKIATDKTTPFEFGTEFQPAPPTFITSEDILYKYVGYRLDNGDVIQDKPNKTKNSINLEYVYKKADKYINVTVPTELVFGTFNDAHKISSKEYQIKNNSSEIATKITLESFMKVDSDIKLLGEDEEVTNEESAKLNLLVDGEPIIKGLNELVSNRDINSLAPKQTVLLGIDGIYYGDKSNKHIVEYKTKLKFKAIEDSHK
ncbi:hypothetical protein E3O82_002453 [Enterococcus faecalis]|nr:hypothetical protein [Enterococcus faecalis]